MAFTFGCATAPAAKEVSTADSPAVITDITVQGDTLTISGSRDFTYTIYSSNDPYKMTVEIPDMQLGNFRSKMDFDNAAITEIMPAQVESSHPSVKLELTLQAPSSAVPQYKNSTLTLLVRSDASVAADKTKTEQSDVEKLAADTAAESSKAAVAKEDSAPRGAEDGENTTTDIHEEATSDEAQMGQAAPMQQATEITGIELTRADGAVKVVISGNGSMTPNVFPLDGRIVVDIPSVSLKASAPESVIQPLKGIRAGKHKDKVRVVLDLAEKTRYDVSSEGSSVVIALRSEGSLQSPPPAGAPQAAAAGPGMEGASPQEAAVEEAEPAAKAITSVPDAEKVAGKYTGKKISLDFQDAEIGPIFRLLADVNGYNLVLDPSVKGKITIKLMNVPWDQALDIILNTFNLSKSVEGNILWIAPTGVFAKILDDKTKEKEAAEKAEPLTQEIIRVNYAIAGDVSSAITQGKLLSPRGSITIDARMNTLIIKDTASSIAKVKDLVKIMDVSKPQVMIEAKLVQVSTDYSESLGINWGGSFATQTWPNTLNGSFSVNTPTVAAGPGETNPGGALNLTVGHANAVNVSLSLSALESIGKSRTLSNPRVLTMDNEAATIQQGRTFFIATVSQSGTQTQSQQATLSLTVTPKITPDGYIQLKVTATDNSLEPGTAGADAVVDTKMLTTQALVKNSETLVLGGIYTTDESVTDNQVPILGNVPGLGWLFKTRNRTGPNVKELLIFITPTVIRQPKPAAQDGL
jgi:type IV pilus secretin PilQ/predicted competence protein